MDVLGVQVGPIDWMCYRLIVLDRQVGATSWIGYRMNVLRFFRVLTCKSDGWVVTDDIEEMAICLK